MLALRIDATSSLELRWPTTPQKTLELAAAYLSFEATQPADQAVAAPALSQIQAAYDEAMGALQSAGKAEVSRASAAEDYRQAVDEAIPLLRRAILMLKARYLDNLAALEAWGLNTRAGTAGVVVTSPKSEKGWLSFLSCYVAQENSLDPSQRLSDPSLASLSELDARIKSVSKTRSDARATRSTQVEAGGVQLSRLADLLQVAAAVLVVTRFNFTVTRDLQQWGYELVEKR